MNGKGAVIISLREGVGEVGGFFLGITWLYMGTEGGRGIVE